MEKRLVADFHSGLGIEFQTGLLELSQDISSMMVYLQMVRCLIVQVTSLSHHQFDLDAAFMELHFLKTLVDVPN